MQPFDQKIELVRFERDHRETSDTISYALYKRKLRVLLTYFEDFEQASLRVSFSCIAGEQVGTAYNFEIKARTSFETDGTAPPAGFLFAIAKSSLEEMKKELNLHAFKKGCVHFDAAVFFSEKLDQSLMKQIQNEIDRFVPSQKDGR